MEVDKVEVKLADGSNETSKYKIKVLADTGMITVALSTAVSISAQNQAYSRTQNLISLESLLESREGYVY